MAKLTQQDLLEIFNALRQQLCPYEKGALKARIDIQGRYELWSEKDIVIQGKKRHEIAFVAIILQSSNVGFYFTPIYTNEEDVRPKIAPELLKNLKGKGCFHITSADKTVLKNVKGAMKVGYDAYKKNGWV